MPWTSGNGRDTWHVALPSAYRAAFRTRRHIDLQRVAAALCPAERLPSRPAGSHSAG